MEQPYQPSIEARMLKAAHDAYRESIGTPDEDDRFQQLKSVVAFVKGLNRETGQ